MNEQEQIERLKKTDAEMRAFIKRQGMALMEIYYHVCPMGWAFPGDNPELIAGNIQNQINALREEIAELKGLIPPSP